MNKKKSLPIIAALIYSFIFGFSFMFTKIGLGVMAPMELIAFRFLLAALTMTLLRALKIIKVDIKGKNIKMLLLTAFCEPVLYFIFEVTGVSMTSTSEAGLMISLIPVFVAIFSVIFLNERLKPVQIGFIILSVSGVIFINMMKDKLSISGSFLGIIFLFIAVIASSFYNIGSKKASINFTPVEITFVMMWVGAISFNSILILTNIIKGTMMSYFAPLSSSQAIFPLLYLGLLSSIVAFFMVNYTISKIPVSESAVFANLCTIVSIFAGVVILKESFLWHDLVGAIMILVGVWGTVYFGEKDNEKDKIINMEH